MSNKILVGVTIVIAIIALSFYAIYRSGMQSLNLTKVEIEKIVQESESLKENFTDVVNPGSLVKSIANDILDNIKTFHKRSTVYNFGKTTYRAIRYKNFEKLIKSSLRKEEAARTEKIGSNPPRSGKKKARITLKVLDFVMNKLKQAKKIIGYKVSVVELGWDYNPDDLVITFEFHLPYSKNIKETLFN